MHLPPLKNGSVNIVYMVLMAFILSQEVIKTLLVRFQKKPKILLYRVKALIPNVQLTLFIMKWLSKDSLQPLIRPCPLSNALLPITIDLLMQKSLLIVGLSSLSFPMIVGNPIFPLDLISLLMERSIKHLSSPF